MSDEPLLSPQDIEKLQTANLRMIAALRPDGALGRAVLYATTALHRGAVQRIHVWPHPYKGKWGVFYGGSGRASQRMDVDLQAGRGTIYTDPDVVRPDGKRPADYLYHEHERAGEGIYERHDFYAWTLEDMGSQVLDDMAEMIAEGMEG